MPLAGVERAGQTTSNSEAGDDGEHRSPPAPTPKPTPETRPVHARTRRHVIEITESGSLPWTIKSNLIRSRM